MRRSDIEPVVKRCKGIANFRLAPKALRHFCPQRATFAAGFTEQRSQPSIHGGIVSTIILNKAWETPLKTHTQKLVLISLADQANHDGVCWPSMRHTARRCDLSRRGVIQIITELKDAGHLKILEDGGGRKTNTYLVAVNGIHPSSEPCSPQGCTVFTPGVNTGYTNHKEPPLRTTKNQAGAMFHVELPEALGTPEFKAAWREWEEHRKQIKHKLTPLTVSKQLKRLADLGCARAVDAIENSISKGYQGIFEETKYDNTKTSGAVSNQDRRRAWEKAYNQPNAGEVLARRKREREEAEGKSDEVPGTEGPLVQKVVETPRDKSAPRKLIFGDKKSLLGLV